MHRSGKGAGLYLLLCILVLVSPTASAYAAGPPPGRALGPDGFEVESPPQEAPANTVYAVRAGDTLWDIAMNFGLTPDDLISLNPGLDPKLLHPGQTLTVPARRGKPSDPAPPTEAAGPDSSKRTEPAPSAAPAGDLYTVQLGDTLWDIAVAHGLTPNDLIAANPTLDPKLLQPGQTLSVPAPRSTSSNITPAPKAPGPDAPKPAGPTPPSTPVGYSYKVQSGDTLWDIAVAHGLTSNDLVAANPALDLKLLHPGQTILVPAPRSASSNITPAPKAPGPDAPKPAGPTPPSTPVGYSYKVQSGDTLWDIARAHGLAPNDLVAANPALDLKLLHPGQTILVPAAQPAAAARKTQPPALPTPVPTKAAPAAPVPAKPAPATPAPTKPAPAPTKTNPPAPAATPVPPPPAPATPGSPDARPTLAAQGLPPKLAGWPEALVKLINEQRVARKLPAVKWSPELAAAAQAHAADCAKRDWGSHVGSDGALLRARLARAGYAPRAASENWANAASAQSAFSMWWNEPPGNDPHRRTILDSNYKEIGIGIVAGRWGYYFVADYGSR